MKNMTGAIYVAGPLDYETRRRVRSLNFHQRIFICKTWGRKSFFLVNEVFAIKSYNPDKKIGYSIPIICPFRNVQCSKIYFDQ